MRFSPSSNALRVLDWGAQVYRRARELWPLRATVGSGHFVTVRIDQLKELKTHAIANAYSEGESWQLVKKNDKEAVVERHRTLHIARPSLAVRLLSCCTAALRLALRLATLRTVIITGHSARLSPSHARCSFGGALCVGLDEMAKMMAEGMQAAVLKLWRAGEDQCIADGTSQGTGTDHDKKSKSSRSTRRAVAFKIDASSKSGSVSGHGDRDFECSAPDAVVQLVQEVCVDSRRHSL